ncbi:iron-sulfur cluster insertion protein ErpA [candidate division KSB1 bacterium]|nr:iron-sulfur cluster insertion protein ErpA [candidate division KSB1 bacterium]
MINLSPKAAEEVKKIIAQESQNEGELALRVGVQGGGCSGLCYFLTLDKDAREDDEVLVSNGVKILLDSKSALYLEGTTVDYTDGLQGSGFTFVNPNAQRTCGCGHSFQA